MIMMLNMLSTFATVIPLPGEQGHCVFIFQRV
jgi:hypothetical protein